MTDLEKGTQGGSAQDIIQQTLGAPLSSNEYLVRLLSKALSNELEPKPTLERFDPIVSHLDDQISCAKLTGNYASLLVHTILKEKVADRSAAVSNQQHKVVLMFLTVLLPILTNLIQYLMRRYMGGSDTCQNSGI
jgi:hypothetical protein